MVIIYVGIPTGKQEKYDGTYIKARLINWLLSAKLWVVKSLEFVIFLWSDYNLWMDRLCCAYSLIYVIKISCIIEQLISILSVLVASWCVLLINKFNYFVYNLEVRTGIRMISNNRARIFTAQCLLPVKLTHNTNIQSHKHTHIHSHTHTHTSIHTHTHTHTYTYIHTYTPSHMHTVVIDKYIYTQPSNHNVYEPEAQIFLLYPSTFINPH